MHAWRAPPHIREREAQESVPCMRRSTLSVQAYAQDLLSRRLPLLARAALSGAETPVTPTGQQSARSANAIMVESVLSDSFPMPVCLPLPEEQP